MTRATQNQERTSVLYSCLSHSRRRYALYRLKEADKPLPLADLAEDIADWESDEPISKITDETIEDVFLSLYHKHIPKLEDADLVEYNQEQGTVGLSEYPKALIDDEQLLVDT